MEGISVVSSEEADLRREGRERRGRRLRGKLALQGLGHLESAP